MLPSWASVTIPPMNTYFASLRRIVDGDTVRLDVDLHIRDLFLMNIDCRLARINAPELSTPEGPKATAHLASLLKAVPALLVVPRGNDKYGRLLIDILSGDTTVNDLMVRDGFAVTMMHAPDD